MYVQFHQYIIIGIKYVTPLYQNTDFKIWDKGLYIYVELPKYRIDCVKYVTPGTSEL